MTGAADMWQQLADALTASGRAEPGTMMGSECLRVGGEFIGMLHVKTGELIVKLPADRVDELVGEGVGVSFAPAGRVFREWMAVPEPNEMLWRELLEEAQEFAKAV